jgi:hypothetical protein
MANIESATSELSDARANGLKLLHRLCMRRSTPPRHLTAPGPTDEEIQLLVRAASRAPDHQRLKPFRFLIISSDDREALADVFEAAERELDPGIGGEKLEQAREKARHAPVLVAVISRLQKSDEVPEIEQRASAGAALGYVVLAADLLVLLCHKSRVAAWTSWEFAHESADKLNADGGDRMSDVAFRADRDCHEVRHLRIVEALCR